MCWNEPVSWITLIIGTCLNLFNIFYFRDTTLTLISIALEWLLLMQFFEALAWRSLSTRDDKLNTIASRGAMIANVTQPIIIFLIFITYTTANDKCKIAAAIITGLYIIYILYKLNNKCKYDKLTPSDSCSHLDLIWWKDFSGFIYCLALFSLMLLLIRPQALANFTAGYIGITLMISWFFYSCGVGSMWCWFTSFAPLVIALYYKRSQLF